ncbi:MAG TPA: AtpZ/AtpI family protein [Terriglobales bacterium]|nr:AtpZ/AtpI family protein [Terriglobales bacterium]
MADDDPHSKNAWVTVARYSEIGFIIPAAIGVGYIGGALLDHWLHKDWLPIAGLIFGAIAGFVQMVRMAMQTLKEKE